MQHMLLERARGRNYGCVLARVISMPLNAHFDALNAMQQMRPMEQLLREQLLYRCVLRRGSLHLPGMLLFIRRVRV
jgi:hypothetical protein